MHGAAGDTLITFLCLNPAPAPKRLLSKTNLCALLDKKKIFMRINFCEWKTVRMRDAGGAGIMRVFVIKYCRFRRNDHIKAVSCVYGYKYAGATESATLPAASTSRCSQCKPFNLLVRFMPLVIADNFFLRRLCETLCLRIVNTCPPYLPHKYAGLVATTISQFPTKDKILNLFA